MKGGLLDQTVGYLVNVTEISGDVLGIIMCENKK